MASKRKAKKKSVSKAKKNVAAPKAPPAAPPVKPQMPVPARPGKPGALRSIQGEDFWEYKAQVMEDRTIGLRSEILRLKTEAVERRKHMATLTNLISDLESQLAAKDEEIIGFEAKALETDRLGVQHGNNAILTKLRIDTKTQQVKFAGNSLVVGPIPRELQKK